MPPQLPRPPSGRGSRDVGKSDEERGKKEELEEEDEEVKVVEDESVLDIDFGVLTDKEMEDLFRGKNLGAGFPRSVNVIIFEDKTRRIYVDGKIGKGYVVQSGSIRHDLIGKKHMWRVFQIPSQLQDAKDFARDPSKEQERQKQAAIQTKANKREARRTVYGPNRTFWDEEFKNVYAMVPIPPEAFANAEGQQQQKEQQGQQQKEQQGQQQDEKQGQQQGSDPIKVEKAFEKLRCDARAEVDDGEDYSYATLTFKAAFLEREMEDFFYRCDRAHRQFWNALLWLFKENQEKYLDFKWGDVPAHFYPMSFETYLRQEVLGDNKDDITPGVRNCAKHIPLNGRTREQVQREVAQLWHSIPKGVFWSAVQQLKSAFDSNFKKIALAKKENRPVKGFDIKFRKSGKKPEVIDLPGPRTFMTFREETSESIEDTKQKRKSKKSQNAEERKARADKRAEEKAKFIEEVVKSPEKFSEWVYYEKEKQYFRYCGNKIVIAEGEKKGEKKDEVLKNNVRTASHRVKLSERIARREQRQQQQNAASAPAPVAAPAPDAAPTSTAAAADSDVERGGKKKKAFIIGQFGAKVIGAKKKEIKLCGSAKSGDEILAEDGKNIHHKCLRYDTKTKELYVDVIVRRKKTSSEANKDEMVKEKEEAGASEAEIAELKRTIIAAIDPGINPFFLAVNTRGQVLRSNSDVRIKLLEQKEKIDALQSKIAKRDHGRSSREQGNKRTPSQYRKTTRKLQKKLAEMRVHLKRSVKDYHYREARELFKFCDVLVVNKLKVQQILQESKKDGSLSRHARRNMLTLSPGYFVEVLKHVARRTPGKKVIFGCGEQWTSRTCTGCGKVNNDLGLSKELKCQKCGLCIDRDVNGALNNLKEVLNKLFEANGELKVLPPPPPPKQRKRRHQRRKGQQQNVGVVEGEDVQNNNIDEQ